MADLDHWHDHCSCTTEPVFQGAPGDPAKDRAGLAEQLELDQGEQLLATEGMRDSNGEQLYMALTRDADGDQLLRVATMPGDDAAQWTGFDDGTQVLGQGGIDDLRGQLTEAIDAGKAHQAALKANPDAIDIDDWVFQGNPGGVGLNVADRGIGDGSWELALETGSPDGLTLNAAGARKLQRMLEAMFG